MAINKLSPAKISKTKPTDSEQLLSDGGGLFVRIRSKADGGAKSFRLAYRIDGKQRWLTLGNYEVMTLLDLLRQLVCSSSQTKQTSGRNRLVQLLDLMRDGDRIALTGRTRGPS